MFIERVLLKSQHISILTHMYYTAYSRAEDWKYEENILENVKHFEYLGTTYK